MELFDQELSDARALLGAQGLDPAAFTMTQEHLPPDEDTPSMFTMRYEVTVSRAGDGVAGSRTYTGGIGLHWVREFEADLKAGRFGAG